MFSVAKISKGMNSIIGDIRDRNNLTESMRSNTPDIIIHMAAQALVRRSYLEPEETFSTNIMGTVNLLEAVRKTPSARAVLIVTSDKSYENKEWVWGYRETEPMGGADPYSSSKACAELITAAYRTSYFHPNSYDLHKVAIATARAGNVIGGGDWAEDRLIPDVLSAFEKFNPAVIRNPNSTRPWQHVLEPLSGYMLLLKNLYEIGPPFAQAWNFGPKDEGARSVEWVVGKITQKWGVNASWIAENTVHPHEANSLKLDCSKAKSLLGWQPKWSLEYALDMIIDWHKAYLLGLDMSKISLKQINEYSLTEDESHH
jgi:CDP-glucose 4,6-dehydratase